MARKGKKRKLAGAPAKQHPAKKASAVNAGAKASGGRQQFVLLGDAFLQPRWQQLAVLAALTLLAYAGSYSVGWYLDDYPSIRENLAIRDLGDWQAVYGFSPARFVSYFSFALNYALHGYQLAGYHLVNNLVHLWAGLVVYFLVHCLLKTPAVLASKSTPPTAGYLPFLVALLFVLHPLQSQAVVYIVQRSAALAALFYLLSVLCYVRARLAEASGERWLFAVLATLCFVFAVFSKQNAATLPLAILGVELCFFQWQTRQLLLGAAVSALLGVLAVALLWWQFGDGFFSTLSAATSETEIVGRWQYLSVQVGVVWEYIGRWILPLQQQLDFDKQPIDASSPWLWLAAAGHVLLLVAAVLARQRFPFLAFAVVFYYSAHLVESSLIPIRDFAFEHRTYLPNFGLALAAAWVFLQLLPGGKGSRPVLIAAGILSLSLGLLTFNRVSEWRDPPRFFAGEIAANPQSLRPWSMLGEYYLRTRDNAKAAEVLLEGYEKVGQGYYRENNTEVAFLQNLVLALDRVDRDSEAFTLLAEQDLEIFDPLNRSKMLLLRGNLIAQQGRPVLAENDFLEALRLNGRNGDAKLSLGKVLFQQARLDEADQTLREYLANHPFHIYRSEAEELLAAIPQARLELEARSQDR